jgi:farnesyl-diphosphate farnesyltransferase
MLYPAKVTLVNSNKNIVTELNFQNEILNKVSRSFALTIPLLPSCIKDAVANCYLWCRISDSLEDDPKLTLQQKLYFHKKLIKVLHMKIPCENFVNEVLPMLSEEISIYEKTLIQNINYILNITNNLNLLQKNIVKQCVTTMNKLMPKFEKIANKEGLKNIFVLNNYCYAVAGIVGETLTKLFCNYCCIDLKKQAKLIPLAISFGQALQMTNILKDRWSDYSRKICWLPKDCFENCDISLLLKEPSMQLFVKGIKNLIKINHKYLEQALHYVLLIPSKETGIRRFCLWAIGIAVATLKNINNNPGFCNVKEIKVSRTKLKLIIFITDLIARYNYLLKIWFKYFSYKLKRL